MPARSTAAPVLLAVAVAGVYLIWAPPSTDLAAQTFRAQLFEESGFALFNTAWYGGHHTLGYSVVFPPLAWLLGVREAGALAAVAAAGLFAVLARRRFGEAALLASVWFALGASTWLFTGRLTFLLGVAIGLGALLAADRRQLAAAAPLAALAALASPVAGLFLGLAGVALALTADRAGGAALALPAAAAILALNLAFPTGGEQPYPFSTFVAIPVFAALALWLLPREQRALRVGIALYAAFALAVFVVPTPIGSNVARLGALFAGPVAALALIRRPALLALFALPLLYWQLNGPVEDLEKGLGDPATERAYYEPLLDELEHWSAGGRPLRIEIPPTRNRWEAAFVAPEYPLARGWLRQLESDDFELFTDGNLTAAAYEEWLRNHGVSYVAVPDADLDYLSEDEAALIRSGEVASLRSVWSDEHWELYRVHGTPELGVDALGPDWFEVVARHPGPQRIRLRYTPYWSVAGGGACVAEDDKGWTVLDVEEPGDFRVEARLLGDSCPR